jgi:hypothetical protein
MWTHRDQFTHEQIPFDETDLITRRQESRLASHLPSATSKATAPTRVSSTLRVGDLVYVISDQRKSCTRPCYILTHIDGDWASIRKFTGSQLRNFTYRVKLSECYKVPSGYCSPKHSQSDNDEQDLEVTTDIPLEDDKDPQPSPLETPAPTIPDNFDQPPMDIVANSENGLSHTVVEPTLPTHHEAIPVQQTDTDGPSRRSSRTKKNVFRGHLKDYVQ